MLLKCDTICVVCSLLLAIVCCFLSELSMATCEDLPDEKVSGRIWLLCIWYLLLLRLPNFYLGGEYQHKKSHAYIYVISLPPHCSRLHYSQSYLEKWLWESFNLFINNSQSLFIDRILSAKNLLSTLT